MYRIIAVLSLLALSAGSTAAEASDPSVVRLSLKEAITVAMEHNHSVKAAGYSAKAASHGIAIANSHYYPSILFEEDFAVSNAPTQTFMMKLDEGRFSQNDFLINNLNHPSSHHDFKTALTIQQPLYNPATGALRDMAVKDSEKESLSAEAARQESAFQVFRLYLEVQRATAQRNAAGQAQEEARESLRLTRVRGEAGVGLKSDELRARTHLASVEQQLISASNSLQLAQMQLADVTGLREASRVEISDSATSIDVSRALEDLIATALDSRQDIRQSRAELEKGDAGLKLARSAYLPTVGAFASYQMNSRDVPFGNDNDAWVAGASLKWHIFDGFRRYNERDRAEAGRQAASEMLESRMREVSYQVRESVLRREESAKRLEVARHALSDAEETVRLLKKRFENSLATMVELLDAQTALNQARASLAETETYYALAGGRVYHAAGIFLKEMLK